MKNSQQILENYLEDQPEINLALGIERGDLGKIERALIAGALDISYNFGRPYQSINKAKPFKDVWEMADYFNLCDEGQLLLRKYIQSKD